MSYEKQTWQTGDTVTSAKLNHMEDGIAAGGSGGGLLVTITFGDSSATMDKTFNEITAAIAAGCCPVFVSGVETAMTELDYMVLQGTRIAEGVGTNTYYVDLLAYSVDGFEKATFQANSADGVLTYTYPGG